MFPVVVQAPKQIAEGSRISFRHVLPFRGSGSKFQLILYT
jgi:hypothetical protein